MGSERNRAGSNVLKSNSVLLSCVFTKIVKRGRQERNRRGVSSSARHQVLSLPKNEVECRFFAAVVDGAEYSGGHFLRSPRLLDFGRQPRHDAFSKLRKGVG